jgi:hypothetical protein
MADQMQTKSFDRTSKTQALIRTELLKIGTLTEKIVGAPVFDLWIETLFTDRRTKDLSEEGLRTAFAKLKSTFKPTSACQFPTPAHLFEFVDTANGAAQALLAEKSWQEGLAWIGQYFHPDLGVDRRAPALDEKIVRAIKAAGGMAFLWECPTADLVWRKKDFLENYAHQEEIERDQNLISGPEAQKILERFYEPVRQLPEANSIRTRPPMTAEEMQQAMQPTSSASKVTASTPHVVIRTPEMDERIRQQKEEIKRRYPEPPTPEASQEAK